MFVSKINFTPAVNFNSSVKSSNVGETKEDSFTLSAEGKAFNTLYSYYLAEYNDKDPDYKGIAELEEKYPEQTKKAKEAVHKYVTHLYGTPSKMDAESLQLKGEERAAYDTLYEYYYAEYCDKDPDYKGIAELEAKYPDVARMAEAKAKQNACYY